MRLDAPSRDALSRVLADPKFELIPLRNATDQVAFLPAGALVSVTASPAKGIEATVDLSARLTALGFRAVPHLSAHMIHDRSHLTDVLHRLEDGGVSRAFVVGGDSKEPGAFRDGLSLLRGMAEVGHGLAELGVPCYPEGHPTIPTPTLLEALAAKQPFVQYMTTQMCFDAAAIERWLAARRGSGITLPVHLGIPGVAELRKLMAISARIGVADTRKFLMKNPRLVVRLLVRPGGYHPDGLLERLAPLIADPLADIRDLHLYTFNQVATTEAWRQAYLARHGLAVPGSTAPAG